MIKPIITNITVLRRPCLAVEPEENIKDIIQDLKDTLEKTGGLGISANQIGVQKKISFIKIPKEINKLTKKIEFTEFILINIKIEDKQNPVRFVDEGCISFKGVKVTTKRYTSIVIRFLNEQLQEQVAILNDLQAIVTLHEYSHQLGKTLFDDKWKAR